MSFSVVSLYLAAAVIRPWHIEEPWIPGIVDGRTLKVAVIRRNSWLFFKHEVINTTQETQPQFPRLICQEDLLDERNV
jgi:hypothetical protein